MSNFTIEAVARENQGKGASRRLRKEGLVPAVVYGADKEPVSLSLINKDFVKLTNNDSFFSSIITLVVDGKEEKVNIKDGNIIISDLHKGLKQFLVLSVK